jgi:hypothetical protein
MRRTTGGNVLGLALSAALTLAEACAASPPPSPASGASPSPAGVAGAAAGSSPIDWVGMTHAERRDHMRTVVMPKAKELFVAYDPARYAKMSCATCHGDGADDGTFKMPNPKLPKLPSSPEGFKQLIAAKPAACQFMLVKLKPTMAALLGMPVFNPDTRTGFGCMNCHAK